MSVPKHWKIPHCSSIWKQSRKSVTSFVSEILGGLLFLILSIWRERITKSEIDVQQVKLMPYIKTVMISHQTEMDISGVYNSNIEPIRWKLITTRIFLDIPTNEFPDFGQVGGDDYVTIPWPYTTPIIGGVSEDSKYSKSINDILGGGKIGNLDIIDETFLVEARENDELGKNIEKMDLEQVRFFNTGSYDMNTLLEIPSDYYEINDISPSALDDYSFPVFYEEFSSVYSQNYTLVENQVSPSTLSFSNDDVDYWLQHGRPDIAHWIDVNERCLNGEECPKVLDNFGNFLSGNNLPEELYESIYWNSYVNNFNTLFTPTGGQYGQCRTQSDINGDDINDIRYCTPKWPPTSALPTPLEGLFSHGSEDYFFSNIGAPVNYLPSQNQVMGNQWNTWGNAFNPDTGEGGAPPGGYFGATIIHQEGYASREVDARIAFVSKMWYRIGT